MGVERHERRAGDVEEAEARAARHPFQAVWIQSPAPVWIQQPPGVTGEDAGDRVGEGEQVDEDERGGGAPDRAPAAGEDGGACGILELETRDDVAEDRVGEAADSVRETGLGEAECRAARDTFRAPVWVRLLIEVGHGRRRRRRGLARV